MSDRDFFEPYGAPGSSPSVPGFGNNVPRRMQNVMLSETHIFLADAAQRTASRLQSRERQSQSAEPGHRSEQGRRPANHSANPRDTGLSQIGIAGFSVARRRAQQPAAQHVQRLPDHRQRELVSRPAPGALRRRYPQDGTERLRRCAFARADSIRGISPETRSPRCSRVFPATPEWRVWITRSICARQSYNFYAQDTVRLRPGLTMMLGVRYEYNTPAVDSERSRESLRSRYRLDHAGRKQRHSSRRIQFRQEQPGSAHWHRLGSGCGAQVGWFAPVTASTSTRLRWHPARGSISVLRISSHKSFIPSAQFPIFLENPFPSNYPGFVPNGAFTFQRDLRTPYLQHWNLDLQRVAMAIAARSK